MIKKVFLILIAFVLLSFSSDSCLREGDSILNSQIKIASEINHSFVFYYNDYDLKFGFVDKRMLDFKIALEPQFEDVYQFDSCDGCLVWVKKGGKWGVLDIDDFETKTDFIYSRISEFKEVSYDEEFHKAVYEAQAELDGEITTVSIEKYVCLKYHSY